jgi:hypothetical protein
VDPDGNYNIYINARLGHFEQQDVLEHELHHIRRRDFEAPASPIAIEAELRGAI